ncbi:hypothetical protein [Actinoplanes missouriensis]|uniref:hypothetical protein n=1 Tax=Actinoplanes missouriensis TaxID=1866 RepID=UPI0002D4967B|nr:hypothetical protein [Actinoplanes missouriensis]
MRSSRLARGGLLAAAPLSILAAANAGGVPAADGIPLPAQGTGDVTARQDVHDRTVPAPLS